MATVINLLQVMGNDAISCVFDNVVSCVLWLSHWTLRLKMLGSVVKVRAGLPFRLSFHILLRVQSSPCSAFENVRKFYV